MRGFFPSSDGLDSKRPTTIARCGRCGLSEQCRSPRMKLSGEGKRRILIVGEAPGQIEDRDGIQFAGNAGCKLSEVLNAVGVDMRQDCWITNAVRCRPPGNVMEDRYVESCRPNVLRDIERVKPRVVILLGASAVKSVIGPLWKESPGPISQWVGWRIPGDRYGAWLCPTYHPSYLLRSKDPVLEVLFRRHLESALEKLGDVPVVPNYGRKVRRVYDPKKAAAILRAFRKPMATVAFDYETNCLKPDSDWAEIVSCSVCFRGRNTIAFPWVGEAVVEMGRLLLAGNVKKIGANIKFEERWTRRILGHGVAGWSFDTMLGAHLLDNRQGITGLKFQAFVQLGVAPYDGSVSSYLRAKDSRSRNRIREVDMRDLLLYNGMDALLTYKLAMEQRGGFN